MIDILLPKLDLAFSKEIQVQPTFTNPGNVFTWDNIPTWDGWRLPTSKELYLLSVSGLLKEGAYWSCDEVGDDLALAVSMNLRKSFASYKTYPHKVRLVRNP
jgi:hypothetical protein